MAVDEIATRLSTAYNDTGGRATSYDGLEPAGYNGWGGYGFARLVNGVYRQLDSKEFRGPRHLPVELAPSP
ncbi:hypothetical protein ACFWOJ_12975 [Streptomyces sp. NPDC058439]|uniref:hypothetical protein n=1 Tax=Streptomyces sp. NPDC058439 TaxID=3346500 RepID=UPI00364E5148